MSIAEELNTMAEQDQKMRATFLAGEGEFDDYLDHKNTERLKAIVAGIGWPTISKVGEEASSNAWLLVQHADHDLAFQKDCLQLMKDALEGDVALHDIAYLEDRVATSEGKPQIYGTQFKKGENGDMIPLPMVDPERVNIRRSEMDLSPIEDTWI